MNLINETLKIDFDQISVDSNQIGLHRLIEEEINKLVENFENQREDLVTKNIRRMILLVSKSTNNDYIIDVVNNSLIDVFFSLLNTDFSRVDILRFISILTYGRKVQLNQTLLGYRFISLFMYFVNKKFDFETLYLSLACFFNAINSDSSKVDYVLKNLDFSILINVFFDDHFYSRERVFVCEFLNYLIKKGVKCLDNDILTNFSLLLTCDLSSQEKLFVFDTLICLLRDSYHFEEFIQSDKNHFATVINFIFTNLKSDTSDSVKIEAINSMTQLYAYNCSFQTNSIDFDVLMDMCICTSNDKLRSSILLLFQNLSSNYTTVSELIPILSRFSCLDNFIAKDKEVISLIYGNTLLLIEVNDLNNILREMDIVQLISSFFELLTSNTIYCLVNVLIRILIHADQTIIKSVKHKLHESSIPCTLREFISMCDNEEIVFSINTLLNLL